MHSFSAILSPKSHCLLVFYNCLSHYKLSISRSKHSLDWKCLSPVGKPKSKHIEQKNRRTTSWLNKQSLDYLINFKAHITKTHAYWFFIHIPPHKKNLHKSLQDAYLNNRVGVWFLCICRHQVYIFLGIFNYGNLTRTDVRCVDLLQLCCWGIQNSQVQLCKIWSPFSWPPQ